MTTGHIAFGKDGSVRKHTQRLPATTEGQEAGVVAQFVEHVEAQTGVTWTPKRLPQNDNDYLLDPLTSERGVKLELTEVVFRDYARKISPENYSTGAHPYQFIVVLDDEYYGVDQAAYGTSLARAVLKKTGRNYDKPADRDFWLLLWTVAPMPPYILQQSGQWQAAPAVDVLTSVLHARGADPFDAIWLAEHPYTSHQLWPVSPSRGLTAFN